MSGEQAAAQEVGAEGVVEQAKTALLSLKSMRSNMTMMGTVDGQSQPVISIETAMVFPASIYQKSGAQWESCRDSAQLFMRTPPGAGRWMEVKLSHDMVEMLRLPQPLIQTDMWYLNPSSIDEWTLDTTDPTTYTVRARLDPSASSEMDALLGALGVDEAIFKV